MEYANGETCHVIIGVNLFRNVVQSGEAMLWKGRQSMVICQRINGSTGRCKET